MGSIEKIERTKDFGRTINSGSEGCNRYATKKNFKTAKSNTLRSLSCADVSQLGRCWRLRKQHLMTTKSMSVFFLILATNSFAQVAESDAVALHNESALFKRQNHKWYESFLKEMCSTHIKWDNACLGKWVGTEKTISSEASKSQHVPHYQALSILKNAISTTYNELRSNTSDINISDTNKTWATHKKLYKFLPRIKKNAKLSLRSWHRQTQIYAASFTYLRRAQLYYDYKRYNEETSESQTLRKFELAALHILCEIETTINITTANLKQRLRIISPRKMHRIVKFHTREKSFSSTPDVCANDLRRFDTQPPTVNTIDLKFAKFRFLSLLRATRKILKRKIMSRSNISHSSNSRLSQSNYSSSINTSHSSSHSNTDSSFLNPRSIDSNSNSLNHYESGHSNSVL